MTRSILLLPILAALSACALSMGPPTTTAEALPVAVYGADGTRVGTAVLTADSSGLAIALEVARLAPGRHAVRILEHGLCERPDFLSAGSDLFDLQGIDVGPDGRGRAALRYAPANGRFAPKTILGGDGSALVIYDGPPGPGSSGTRIACGIMV